MKPRDFIQLAVAIVVVLFVGDRSFDRDHTAAQIEALASERELAVTLMRQGACAWAVVKRETIVCIVPITSRRPRPQGQAI